MRQQLTAIYEHWNHPIRRDHDRNIRQYYTTHYRPPQSHHPPSSHSHPLHPILASLRFQFPEMDSRTSVVASQQLQRNECMVRSVLTHVTCCISFPFILICNILTICYTFSILCWTCVPWVHCFFHFFGLVILSDLHKKCVAVTTHDYVSVCVCDLNKIIKK